MKKTVERKGDKMRAGFLQRMLSKLFVVAVAAAATVQAGDIGFCYGRFADNLPSPPDVATFLVQKSIFKVRIFDNDQSVIQAFANTNIQLVIGIPNNDLSSFQVEQQADSWVSSYLAPLIPATNITTICVGSEVITNSPSSAPLLLPAMKNLHTALTKANLSSQVQISTSDSMAILQNSFPPSSASFNQSFATSFMKPLLDYLRSIGSFVMINVYPYLAYGVDPSLVPLDYALFQAAEPVVDPSTNLQYTSLFDAQLDALYFAMEGMGHDELKLVVTETGWPTKGDADEPGASVQNAASYNNHLVARVLQNVGTPHRPNEPVDVYIFSLYNEDRKTGPESERNWGVFKPDGTNVYSLDLTGTAAAPPSGSAPILSANASRRGTWCVAKPGASNSSLSDGINWACGPGHADCSAIQSGQACFQPDTFQNHASYAYNSYFQKNNDNETACNFNSTAMTTDTDPSYGSCKFLSVGAALSPISSTNGSSSSAPARHFSREKDLKIIAMVLLFAMVI